MRLVILGTDSVTAQFRQLITQQIDSINIDTFSSIEDFVENTTIRTVKYDRMLFISTVVPKSFTAKQKEQQLYGLLEYVSRRMPELRIVTLCRDVNEYDMYRSVFNVPIYANANISKGINANLIMSAVENDIGTLKVQLEGQENTTVETISQTVNKKEEPKNTPVVMKEPEVKKEKGGFFRKLFGGKDKKNKKDDIVKAEELINGSEQEVEGSKEADVDAVDDTKFELPKFDNTDEDVSEEVEVPVVQAVHMVDKREKWGVNKSNDNPVKKPSKTAPKVIESTGVKYEYKKKEYTVENTDDTSKVPETQEASEIQGAPATAKSVVIGEQNATNISNDFNVYTQGGTANKTSVSQQDSVEAKKTRSDKDNTPIINPMTGKPLYKGKQEQREEVKSTKKEVVKPDEDIDSFISNLSSGVRKTVTSTQLPDVTFETKQEDNVVIDTSDDSSSKSGVTIVGKDNNSDDFDDELEMISSSKRHREKTDTAKIESVSFNTDINKTNVIIDDSSNSTLESGVKIIGKTDDSGDEDIIIPEVSRPRSTVNTNTIVEQTRFDVDRVIPTYNVDTSDNTQVKAGVQKVTTAKVDNVDDDDDNSFDVAFIKKDYRRRQSSTHGDIGLLPTFDDITIAETSQDDVADTVDDDDLSIDIDPAFMTPTTSGQPKVVEKVVERVVEKPVEVIKEVEKVVEVPVEKVVEREVVKEKTVYVAGGSAQAHTFKQIMSKKEPVYLLVTGDRRSGVTTTALSFANIFGSQMKTLYVDLDTETHASVIRLGITDIIDQPDSVQEGLKNLRSPKGLRHLVYWGNNKFGSLITNFNTEISDEEITRATNAIAVQQDFNLVVIDCPFSKLHLLDDILPLSDVIICMDGTAQGVINTMGLFADLTDAGISKKVQNMMFRSARILITGVGIKPKEVKENMEFVNDIFKLTEESIPWINTPVMGYMDNFVKAVKNM